MSKASDKAKKAFGATLVSGLQSRGGSAQLPAQAAASQAVDLSPEARLAELEQLIEASVATYQDTVKTAQQRHRYELGQLLEEIRDRDLYKAAGFEKFGHYVTGRWGWKRAHAYRLIDLAAVRRALLPLGDVADSMPEGQAREYAPVVRYHGDDKARELLQNVTAQAESSGRPATAVLVKEVRAELQLGVPSDGLSPIGDSDAEDVVVDAEIVDDTAELVNQEIQAAAAAAEKAVRLLDEALAREVAPFDLGEAAQDLSRIRSAAVKLGRRADIVPGPAGA
ncbi:hypothetical protein [Streptomyces sp. NPDC058572]|uniref:hypothetical protein n=1 Tax=Streptomyces sp. NPDC058572 TaxID=3346546 RepID=UPI00365A63FE